MTLFPCKSRHEHNNPSTAFIFDHIVHIKKPAEQVHHITADASESINRTFSNQFLICVCFYICLEGKTS